MVEFSLFHKLRVCASMVIGNNPQISRGIDVRSQDFMFPTMRWPIDIPQCLHAAIFFKSFRYHPKCDACTILWRVCLN